MEITQEDIIELQAYLKRLGESEHVIIGEKPAKAIEYYINKMTFSHPIKIGGIQNV